jgi:hypothetical protein
MTQQVREEPSSASIPHVSDSWGIVIARWVAIFSFGGMLFLIGVVDFGPHMEGVLATVLLAFTILYTCGFGYLWNKTGSCWMKTLTISNLGFATFFMGIVIGEYLIKPNLVRWFGF